MRRLAKASSTQSYDGSGNARNRFFGRGLATRGGSGGANGSGAPSKRRRSALALGALVVLLTLVAGVALALAATKKTDSYIGAANGATGVTGGLFNTPRGIGVNQNGTGGAAAGDLYVADSSSNRIQQFTAAGAFVRAWGTDVSTAAANEMQAVAVNATAGQFNLTFGAGGVGVGTTTDLAFNATTAQVQSALNALTNVSTGGGSVTVSGGPGDAGAATPYIVNFNGGPLAGTNVAEMTSAAGTTALSGGTGTGADEAKVSTFAGGGAVTTSFEICEVAASCKAATTAATGGGMSAPQGVAVNQTNGHVYVTDQNLLRVSEFDAKGNFVRAWGKDVIATGPHADGTNFEICGAGDVCKGGESASVSGAFKSTFSGQLAVAPAGSPNAGDVYVADGTNFRIQEFTAAGAFVRMWGRAVDGTEVGDSFEICSAASGHTCKAGVPGTEVGAFSESLSFGGPNPTRVAVDSTGKVFVPDNGTAKRVLTFGPSGTGAASFYSATAAEWAPAEIAIGPANSVFVLQPCPENTINVAAVCPGSPVNEARIKEFNAAGVLQSTSLVGAGFAVAFSTSINGIAVSQTSDKIYFSTSSGAPGSRIWVADNDGSSPPPVATINDPTEITAHSANLSGAVNPNGLPGITTSYRFEYSKNGVTWSSVAADVNLGEGVSSINVPTVAAQGELTGLQANTLYRVRVVATRAFGAGSVASAEKTFFTDSPAPELQTFYPQSISDTSAQLAGVLNADNLPTTYRFEFGETIDYGTNVPIPDGAASDGLSHLIIENIGGLDPSTTYHYRLVATNSEGTTKGTDVSFTTRAAGASVNPGRGYEMVTPPFKTSPSASKNGSYANPGVPSLDGENYVWTIAVFPLNNEVEYPYAGDIAKINRTATGWDARTLLTQRPKTYDISVGAKGAQVLSMSGDLGVQQFSSTLPILPIAGDPAGFNALIRFPYTRRDGTGVNGFTAWNPTVVPTGPGAKDIVLFNDDGSWMARGGEFRGLLGATAAQDPSVSQLTGTAGGQTVYMQEEAPTGDIAIVNGCTGSGSSATQIPARLGAGNLATDTIGTQPCEEVAAVKAEGAATRTSASPTLTGVTTSSGTFAVGQVVTGTGIAPGSVISAVGAGTLTLSINAVCGPAVGTGTRASGSPTLTAVTTTCGAFEVGQTITGTGIPAATTIIAVGAGTLTLSANATSSGANGAISVTGPAPVTNLVARNQNIVSFRGATLGGSTSTANGPSSGPVSTSMSNDGRRIFFESPDPNAASAPTTCANFAGPLTSCAAQLYVRQFDENHENPVVRWISRSTVAGQQIGLMGNGTGFAGASRDGSVVYFRSNAPLTADDPNGAGVAPPPGGVTTGTASTNSVDLFRYELPESGDPSTGTLTRISGGPGGTGDSNGANARYVSDDGKRAYFVTNAPIPGADTTAPTGGITVPGGTPTGTIRNLYLFDATKSGADRYRFIAQLPSTDSCATTSQPVGASLGVTATKLYRAVENKCVRGTQNGDVIAFMSTQHLTSDDVDTAEDIYVYDLRRDELTRASAPLPGEPGGICQELNTGKVELRCNGDFGMLGYNRGLNDDGKRGWGGERQNSIGVDDQGRVSVYFETASRLVPEDTNGAHWDTYQWREGKVTLVSPGNTEDDAYFAGNGLDGRNVFFQTSQQIDPRDVSPADFDIYDARVGGGFPYTPPPAPCDVLALKCEGNAIPAAPVAAPVSSEFKGSGNVKQGGTKPKCGKGKVRKNGKCVKKPKKQKSKSNKRTANTEQGSGE